MDRTLFHPDLHQDKETKDEWKGQHRILQNQKHVVASFWYMLFHRQPKLMCEMGHDPSMKAILGYTAVVLKFERFVRLYKGKM